MYAASVPVFRRYLGQLAKMLDVAETHARSQGLDPQTVLQARLASDMLPFALQIDIAAQFALRACAPLAGLDVPPFGAHSNSFTELRARIARSHTFLDGLTPAQMADGAQRPCRSQAGEAWVHLDGADFLWQYALPNFFFHATTAYAILRHQGIRLGKGDFDGLHIYS